MDLRGKRVAVIGTGASSIQIVPEVANGSATWTSTSAPRRRSSRAATAPTRASRGSASGTSPVQRPTGPASTGAASAGARLHRDPKLAAPEKRGLANIARGISDPALREEVTPDFEIGCKRILISNDYYPALDADNVDLVTDGIAKITGDAIVTADGTERPIDVLVVATGFFTTEQPIAEHIVGREGRSLAEVWRETGMAGYKGTTVARLPQLLLDRRPEHRAGTLEHGLHDRVADRLHPRRRPHHGDTACAAVEPRATRRPRGTTTCSAG